MKRILRWLLRALYRVEVYNPGVLTQAGPVLLLPNHVSWWDRLLIGVWLDDDWRFVTSNAAAQRSWVHRKIMVNKRTFPIDVNSPYAVKHMAEFLRGGGRLVLFPEGRITSTGSLMKLFDGTGFLVHKTQAKVITAYIRGAQKLPFSRNPDPKRFFPKISVHFSQVLTSPSVGAVSTTKARNILTRWVRDCMVLQQFETGMLLGERTVLEAISAAAREAPAKIALQDATLQPLTYRRLLVGADLLAKQWPFLCPSERVGILLPNVNALPVTLLSLWAAGKVPAIFNYTAGSAGMLACARVAAVRHVITSRVFIRKARIDLEALSKDGIQFHFLEEVRGRIGKAARICAMAKQMLSPGLSPPLTPRAAQAESPAAVVLFTSGSEGEPKAVELSQTNILANVRQMASIIDINSQDRFFNALPLFHSFGLTVGMLLPLVRGIYTFLYLSPLHYKVVPSALYDLACTVFFGTNTFLSGYARKAHPYDFHTVRYLYAGAEKLQEATANLWMRKFGVRIIEGYGATECSPCLSANTPIEPKYGSAGRFLPGIEYRIEPVEGVAEGGRLFVRGPNIMRGYLNPEPNTKFKALGGWYDTGDIVSVDEEGFVHILGRLKRFAKVSGEMVSLAAVEDAFIGAFPQFGLRFAAAVVAVPDEAKGEKLILVTNEPKLTIEQVREAVRLSGLSNLAVPREIKVIHEIPRLGTGKVNLRELQKLVRPA